MVNFSDEYLAHFSRHIRLPGFGTESQAKISKAKILIIGAGGLGSPAMTYLATAGVKKIGLFDPDVVDISNLPRQIVHQPSTVGLSKVTSAAQRLKELNPVLEIEIGEVRLKADNIPPILERYDVVIDGADNFPAKYLINDACVLMGRPLIHAGVLRYTGQVMTIIPDKSACYRCIFPEPPPPGVMPTCEEAGILNTVAGITGLIQATETIKLVAGIGQLLTNRLLILDALNMNIRIIEIKRSDDCPVCGKNGRIKNVTDLEGLCNEATDYTD